MSVICTMIWRVVHSLAAVQGILVNPTPIGTPQVVLPYRFTVIPLRNHAEENINFGHNGVKCVVLYFFLRGSEAAKRPGSKERIVLSVLRHFHVIFTPFRSVRDQDIHVMFRTPSLTPYFLSPGDISRLPFTLCLLTVGVCRFGISCGR